MLGFRREAREYMIRKYGACPSLSTLNKLSAPSVGQGPPIEGYLGRRPLYDFDKFADWALRLIKPQPGRYDRGDIPATGPAAADAVQPCPYAAGSASATLTHP